MSRKCNARKSGRNTIVDFNCFILPFLKLERLSSGNDSDNEKHKDKDRMIFSSFLTLCFFPLPQSMPQTQLCGERKRQRQSSRFKDIKYNIPNLSSLYLIPNEPNHCEPKGKYYLTMGGVDMPYAPGTANVGLFENDLDFCKPTTLISIKTVDYHIIVHICGIL